MDPQNEHFPSRTYAPPLEVTRQASPYRLTSRWPANKIVPNLPLLQTHTPKKHALYKPAHDELVQAHAAEERDEDSRAQNGAFGVAAAVKSTTEEEVSGKEVIRNQS
jgi:hypothetical protein